MTIKDAVAEAMKSGDWRLGAPPTQATSVVVRFLTIDGYQDETSFDLYEGDKVKELTELWNDMAEEMDIPILGIIENMSYFECPDCGKRYSIFGESRIEEIAAQHGIPVLARAPIDPKTAEAVDQGTVEYLDANWIGPAVDLVTGVKP